jgi:LysR family transcriptional activator of mexEF-oprN operon
MATAYARDLDLNLLRVFVVVAETGTVTAAAGKLYLTQPAISAALKRLTAAVGAPLFARQGRGLALTARGRRLFDHARPHLDALVAAALFPVEFDPARSERTIRIGLSDASEAWLLPRLLGSLQRLAPRMRIVVLPVQFRTVGDLLGSGAIDLAVTVADDVPSGVERRALFVGRFACLYDPRFAQVPKKLTRAVYMAHDHVIVSYNGDLRGIVEDLLGERRRVRVSIPTFHGVGAAVEGSALLATVPVMAARAILRGRPALRLAELPFNLAGAPMELLWRTAAADDGAVRFVMDHVARIAMEAFESERVRYGVTAAPKRTISGGAGGASARKRSPSAGTTGRSPKKPRPAASTSSAREKAPC